MDIPTKIRLLIIACIMLAGIVAISFMPPIPQAADYHNFADHRLLFGIPNFWNTLSNMPFLIIGLLGLKLLRHGKPVGNPPDITPGYVMFFSGLLLIAFGSAWYHLSPSNQTLLWDRVPMAVSFMAFFSIIIAENIDARLGRWVLWPLIMLGIASVIYWYVTELKGSGDLRPYLLVQFLPAIVIPVILILFRSACRNNGYIWAVLAAYLAAKITETLDAQLFSLLGIISGHTLKHFFAALGAYFFLLALKVNSNKGYNA
jgi:hypothetical protein